MSRLSEALGRAIHRHPHLGKPIRLLTLVMKEQSVERISLSAAAVAFWAVIAITPTLIALSFIFGRLIDPQTLADAVDEVRKQAPDSFSSLLASQLQAASQTSLSTASWGLAISLITVLWAVSTGVYTFSRAVRLAYGQPPSPYLVTRAIAYVGAITTVILLGILLLVAAGLSAWAASLDAPLSRVIFGLEVLVGVALLTVILWVFFRLSTGRAHDIPYWPGATFGAVAVLVIVVGYGIYLQFATSYQAIYGALASTVILSIVSYVAMYAVLLGAVANAQWAVLRSTSVQPPSASSRPA